MTRKKKEVRIDRRRDEGRQVEREEGTVREREEG
jgi:hypothetical protein